MKWFRNMKIKAKMLLSFFVLIALMMGLSVFAIIQMNDIHAQNVYASNFPSERETVILDFQINMRDLRRIAASIVMYAPLNDPSKIEPLIKDADAAYDLCIGALDKYDNLLITDLRFEQSYITERLEKIDDLRGLIKEYYEEIVNAAAKSALSGDYMDAISVAENSRNITTQMRNSTIELVDNANAVSREADKAASDRVILARVLVIVITAITALMAIGIALYVAGLLSKPLIQLSAFMRRAGATGDIKLTATDVAVLNTYGQNKDEIGDTLSGSAAFVKHVTNIATELEYIANGDLTNEIELLSSADTMGNSLKKMVNNLNYMFSEINVSTNQVSSSSKQIADGSQALAQGSTEQAASIQELSSSISEIATRTKANAVTAGKTSKLSASIKENAERGSQQMDEMIVAVKDINDASQSISKIIKTIDDIAFQTNILALNAAVEAARAGQHGKGFAVVAEEVRNLASKSAEAAKDTGDMIQNSMEKAELGSRIAGETAASLSDIVTGINESTQLINEIASASEEQTTGITQINIGIDQVAQVIHQNSATAEESAAASVEMSGQSVLLQELIAQFKLRGNDSSRRELSSDDSSGQGRFGISERTNTQHNGY